MTRVRRTTSSQPPNNAVTFDHNAASRSSTTSSNWAESTALASSSDKTQQFVVEEGWSLEQHSVNMIDLELFAWWSEDDDECLLLATATDVALEVQTPAMTQRHDSGTTATATVTIRNDRGPNVLVKNRYKSILAHSLWRYEAGERRVEVRLHWTHSATRRRRRRRLH